MPVQYTGNESNVPATRDDVSATLPVDGDPRNASSVNTPTQRLLDFMQRVVKKAGFLDLASTWSAKQTFNNGGPCIELKPGSIDHTYVELFARTSAPNTRSGFLGYGAAGSTVLALVNNLSGGDVELKPGSGGRVSTNANITFTGANPSSTVGLKNTQTPLNVCKAWGVVRNNQGTISVLDGFNVQGGSASGAIVSVAFAEPMASTNYSVCVSQVGSASQSTAVPSPSVFSLTTAGFGMTAFQSDGSPMQTADSVTTFMFQVFGRQT